MKILICSLLWVLFTASISAQNANLERLNSYKIAFFTRRLNLTPQEAERFWPLYNEYQENRNKIQLQRQNINRNFNQNELNMSQEEMSGAADRLIELELEEAGLAKEFHNKIKTVLSPVKVLRLYQAENQFRQQLLNQLRNRRDNTDRMNQINTQR